ncbi:SRPBCC family protein [Ureibacillus composti]
MEKPQIIRVEATVQAPVKKVWAYYTEPTHITKWNSASDDWHTPHAENDLRVGGKFLSRMEAKDGSFGFDFGGVYDAIIPYEVIAYTLGDGRKVKINFNGQEDNTVVHVEFEAESQNPPVMQQQGWQAILDNFKKYVEKTAKQ